MKANTIDEVILYLDEIIEESIETESRIGYFASLYKMVTERIREEVQKEKKESMFEDPERMEILDVLFANKYLDAYTKFKSGEKPIESWNIAFQSASNSSPIVIQHLIIAMNAHINFDLGASAAETSLQLNQPIDLLENDFNQINIVLESLVDTVESQLSFIWPPLKKLLSYVPFDLDRVITSFSMKIARKKAWKFAEDAFRAKPEEWNDVLQERDAKIAKYARDLVSPPWWIGVFIFLAKLQEKSSVADNIRLMNGEIRKKIKKSIFS